MEDHLKEALEIVKAQASVRTMTEDEITSMVQRLASGIQKISEGITEQNSNEQVPPVDPQESYQGKIDYLS